MLRSNAYPQIVTVIYMGSFAKYDINLIAVKLHKLRLGGPFSQVMNGVVPPQWQKSEVG